MEIVVRGRNVVVPDHFRQHVGDKLTRLGRYDGKIHRVDVELHHERNPRQAMTCDKVEITCRTRGPVVRAEACSDDFYKALDQATIRLERRFRQANDRRHVHHGRHSPVSVHNATGVAGDDTAGQPDAAVGSSRVHTMEDVDVTVDEIDHVNGSLVIDGDGEIGRIVRVKEHVAKPMTVDQALLQMELVGHDFFLFADADCGLPSVVYRRKGFDYGVIRLSAPVLPVP